MAVAVALVVTWRGQVVAHSTGAHAGLIHAPGEDPEPISIPGGGLCPQCVFQVEAVCGEDGITYLNGCWAGCAQMAVRSQVNFPRDKYQTCEKLLLPSEALITDAQGSTDGEILAEKGACPPPGTQPATPATPEPVEAPGPFPADVEEDTESEQAAAASTPPEPRPFTRAPTAAPTASPTPAPTLPPPPPPPTSEQCTEDTCGSAVGVGTPEQPAFCFCDSGCLGFGDCCDNFVGSVCDIGGGRQGGLETFEWGAHAAAKAATGR